MDKSFGGIDPGFSGCMAVIRPGGAVEFYDPPVVEVALKTKSKAGNVRHRSEYLFASVAALLRDSDIGYMTIEKTIPMPSVMGRRPLPASSSFASGVGYGMWQMGCACCGIPYQLVAPNTWKTSLLAGQAKTKEGAVAFAGRLYPQAATRLQGPRGGILDGRAEALLLAHFGRLGMVAGSPRAPALADPLPAVNSAPRRGKVRPGRASDELLADVRRTED